MNWILIVGLFSVTSGCATGELTTAQDDQLRVNLSRDLTPEEIALMNGGGNANPDAREASPQMPVKRRAR